MNTTASKQLITTATALPGSHDQPCMLVSTSDVDRDGDRIIPEGMEALAFTRNSPLLWAHDYKSIPIGTVTHLRVIPGKGVQAEWRWLDGDAFAERVKNAWEQGVIRAASIGFKPLRIEPNTFGGGDIVRWELLEISLCPIPANPQATRALKALGLITEGLPLSFNDDVLPPAPSHIDYAVDSLTRTITRGVAGALASVVFPHLDEADVTTETVTKILGKTVSATVVEAVKREVHEAICYHTGRVD